MRFISKVILAATLFLIAVLLHLVSAMADGFNPIPSTYAYAAKAPSTEKVINWVDDTFKRTQPVLLNNEVAFPVCFKVGRKWGSATCTITIKITNTGYLYSVSNLKHCGNGWIEDKNSLEEDLRQAIDWNLLVIRQQFEQWLLKS